MTVQETAIRAIEVQQAGVAPRSPQWMVGEQLKDICCREPGSAALIAQDLEREGMGITAAEKKIKAFADKHKTGNFACVTPAEAEKILRAFYGLPDPGDAPVLQEPQPPAGTGESPSARLGEPRKEMPSGKILDLTDFL